MRKVSARREGGELGDETYTMGVAEPATRRIMARVEMRRVFRVNMLG